MRHVYRYRGQAESWLCGGNLVWPSSAPAAVPVRIDGAGSVSVGDGVALGYLPAPRIGSGEILLQARSSGSRISIGSRTAISNNVTIIAMKSISIGEGCQIGDMVTVFDCDFHEIQPNTRGRSAGQIAPVPIGNNVWLGSRVMVLKGLTIGDNTVVAAGAVVTKSLPANVIAAGVPVRVPEKFPLFPKI
jgi:maltose O-acetyltransferase